MPRLLQSAAFAGVLILASLSPCPLANAQTESQKESPPDVPDAIQVPVGEEVVLFAHATGWQIYTCQSSEGKFVWALKAPEADLHDRKDKVIGKHSAGPKWTLKDGSEVKGKAVAHVDSLDSDSIPWLRVEVVEHSGKGLLSNVNLIQRVRTQGGQPPASGCDADHPAAEARSRYTADYYFYAPASKP
jgi:uncharacterized protein DUF3455